MSCGQRSNDERTERNLNMMFATCKVVAATEPFKLNMHHPIPNANMALKRRHDTTTISRGRVGVSSIHESITTIGRLAVILYKLMPRGV